MGEDRYRMLNQDGRTVTFTESQRGCVDYDSKSALVIKGTAGSGKTFMVVARAREYYNKIREEESKKRIAIFTYNKSLVGMLEGILKVNKVYPDGKTLQVVNADRFIASLCSGLRLIPGSEGYGSKKYSAMEGDNQRAEIVKSVLEELSYSDPSLYFRRDPMFWVEEIKWMYCNGIVDSDDEERYLNLSREGRCKNYSVRLNKEGRKKAMAVFNGYNKALMNKGKFEWDRLYALLERDHLQRLEPSQKFDYVLVDEAQDLSLTKMRIIKALCKGDMCVAMDRNQSIYGYRWSLQRDVGLRTHTKSLKVTFRNTLQIDQLSQDLKKVDDSLLEDEDRYDVETSGLEGDLPCVVHCSSSNEQTAFIVDLVCKLDSDETTAIICPDYGHLRLYYDKLKKKGRNVQMFKKDDDFSAIEPGIKLITFYSAKGLGFTNVIIPNFEEGVFPESPESVIRIVTKGKDPQQMNEVDVDEAIAEAVAESRRLVYVGITRAVTRLFMTYAAKPSPFIKEFDPAHYRLVNTRLEDTSDARIATAMIRGAPEPVFTEMGKRKVPEPEAGPNEVIATGSGPSREETLMSVISGLEYYDRRSSGGALWIVDGPGVESRMDKLKRMGFNILYSKKGGRKTGHRPSYYIK